MREDITVVIIFAHCPSLGLLPQNPPPIWFRQTSPGLQRAKLAMSALAGVNREVNAACAPAGRPAGAKKRPSSAVSALARKRPASGFDSSASCPVEGCSFVARGSNARVVAVNMARHAREQHGTGDALERRRQQQRQRTEVIRTSVPAGPITVHDLHFLGRPSVSRTPWMVTQ